MIERCQDCRKICLCRGDCTCMIVTVTATDQRMVCHECADAFAARSEVAL